jgi:hypothetical protein
MYLLVFIFVIKMYHSYDDHGGSYLPELESTMSSFSDIDMFSVFSWKEVPINIFKDNYIKIINRKKEKETNKQYKII